jgi:hypothetical protein
VLLMASGSATLDDRGVVRHSLNPGMGDGRARTCRKSEEALEMGHSSFGYGAKGVVGDCPATCPCWRLMVEVTPPGVAGAVPSDPVRLHAAMLEARNDAAPFALTASAVLVVLALVSRYDRWELLGHSLWWLWLVVAAPYLCLSATLLFGVGRLVRHDRRREIVIALLALVWVFNVLGVIVLVVSLVAHSSGHITGRQLLFQGGAVWFTDAVAFGLAFWELDCGGPVARAFASAPRKPDFQFPQDENPQLAREGWAPRLWDYFYVSLTNSIAFSPTDAMPLTRRAKSLMAAETTLSAITVILVTARAVNILG